jgi:uncharacterized protein (UPF0276 family)
LLSGGLPAEPFRRVSRFHVPDLGVGVGFRRPHYAEVLEATAPPGAVRWFEVVSENFMVDGGNPLYVLDRLASKFPVIPHGVALSLGSDGDPEHLDRLMGLLRRLDPPWFSDHLCFTGVPGHRVHDLLPVPYTPAMRDHLVGRIQAVQDCAGVPFAIENVSSYLTYRESVMPEWAFLAEVAERADCAILLDVNNVYVSAMNHGFDPMAYLDAIPADRVVQIHLAGHSVKEKYRLDTHDGPVDDAVWALYAAAIQRIGPVSTLIEWDDNIPEFARLEQEAAAASRVRDRAGVAAHGA